jgi:GNAT superfamily N-acetyltransferase
MFEVGCDPESEEFKEYWSRNGYSQEFKGYNHDRLLEMLVNVIKGNFPQLIVWRENGKIVGHAIWHESNTEEHRKGDPRDEEDRQILNRLAGGKEDLVELHEVWLRQKYRGKGYGKQLFEFFEDFLRKRGYGSFVYYADHPTAIHICRERGYKEAFMKKEKWHVFYLSLK